MITVRLKGGLGNQMFQYAIGRALSLKNADQLKLDINYYKQKTLIERSCQLESFNIEARILEKEEIPFFRRYFPRILNLLKVKGVEKSFTFDKNILNLKGTIYLDGYFQSEKYFKEYENIIRKDFTLNNPLEKVKKLIIEIESKNSVCIHIRRGDYVGNQFHPVQDLSYYEEGIKEIEKKEKIDCLYVFDRDDIKWCKENLKFNYPTVYVEADIHSDVSVAETLVLMSSCKHFIIANSSFSWWAVWLSSNISKIVVAPKIWFTNKQYNTKDLIPENWIRI